MRSRFRLIPVVLVSLLLVVGFAPSAQAEEVWAATHRSVTVVEDGKTPVEIDVRGIVAGIAFAKSRTLVATDLGLVVVDVTSREVKETLTLVPEKLASPRFEAKVQAVAASVDDDVAFAAARYRIEGSWKGPAILKVLDTSGEKVAVKATIPMPEGVDEVSAIYPTPDGLLYCFRRLDLAFTIVDPTKEGADAIVGEVNLKNGDSILWDREVREILPVAFEDTIFVPMFEIAGKDAARMVIAEVDTRSKSSTRHPLDLDQTAQCTAISPDGKLLYVASKRVLVLDTTSWTVRANVELENLLSDMVMSADGKKVFAVDGSVGLRRFDAESMREAEMVDLPSRSLWLELRPGS